MTDEFDKTIPGYRDRKTDGRFAIGDLILGRYKVLAELGKGGMGIVYKCEDQTSHVCYAVKTLAPELTDSKWEMEEILYNFQLVQKLHHPNIANYNALELDPQTNRYFLIMEYVEGEDLRYWLRSKRREGADLQQVIPPVVRQIAQALDYAHSQKIVHRDIKPGNIMINGVGNVKVLDFGLAAQIHSSLSRVSIQSVNEASTCGTIPYMAPEQWRGGEAEAASDQYALAATVYEMFSGRPPFDSADKDILRNCTLHEAPRPLKDVSPAIRSAVEKALAKEPEDRFSSCSDFAAALGGAKVGKAKKVSSGKSGGAWKWIAAVIVLALIAAGAFFALNRTTATPTVPVPADTAAADTTADTAADAEARRIAAEQKAAEEKALAEKKAAEEKAREAERQKNLDKEHAALLSKLDQQKKKIQSNSWHTWEQNFNRQWEELQLQETTAKNSTRLDNKVEALEKAVAAADWIVTNAPKREDARKLIEAENALKSAADQYEPMTFAKDLYTAAGADMTEGKAAYEKGDFETALAKLQAGLDGYAKAKEAAYQGKLNFHLDEAETAKKQGDWAKVKSIAMNSIHPLDAGKAQTLIEQAERELKGIALAAELKKARTALEEKRWDDVRTFARAAQRIAADDPDAADLLKKADEGEVAQLLAEAEAAKERKDGETVLAKVNAVLEIESGNQAALALKNEAETHLVPTLQITATVDGASVPATVKIGNNAWRTGDTIRDLKEDSSYMAYLSYRRGETKYTGGISFSCNWKGLKQKTVALKKWEFTGVVTLPGGVPLKMIRVEPGSFMMGSNMTSAQKPVHRVTLTKPYYLGETEVTQAQWRAVMGNNPSHFQGDSRPVERVSWDDAMAFCQKLNDQGRAPKGWKFTLPTEAQWEFACRAGTTTNYSYGDASDAQKMNFDGNYPYGGGSKGVYRQETVAVKSLGYKNAWGFYDMHGNVCEWCLDGYRSYSSSAVTDPQGPDNDSTRIQRGGWWDYGAQACCSTIRTGYNPDHRSNGLGFRLALVPVQ